MDRLRQCFCCGRRRASRIEAEESIQQRSIHIGHSATEEDVKRIRKQYGKNSIKTAKYTWITFLPKALFEQYRRAANIYFTIVAILSLTPYSPVSPVTTVLPLVFILLVSIVKEYIEDARRRRADKELNRRPVHVVRAMEKRKVRWKDVVAGDIVIVYKDESFPADLLFLKSSNPDNVAYVETSDLDGETNLKLKKAWKKTAGLDDEDVYSVMGIIESELPNNSIYTYSGNVNMSGAIDSIGPDEILLRSTTLRNTRYIIGATIFTGKDTKVMQNAQEAPSKRSTMERMLDRTVAFYFLLLFAMVIVSSLLAAIFVSNIGFDMWYLELENDPEEDFDPDEPVLVFFTMFVTTFILYGYLIPISLYVTLELVKVGQAMFYIQRDQKMVHEGTRALARTSNLNEELGMISHVLSDKTGTLTQNQMDFFRASINGVIYGHGVTEIERCLSRRATFRSLQSSGTLRPSSLSRASSLDPGGVDDQDTACQSPEKGFNFADPRLENAAWMSSSDRDVIEQWLLVLALCHTVVPDGDPDDLTYEAESPDEKAFVVAAKRFGYTFISRTTSTVTLRQRTGQGPDAFVDKIYEVLDVLEFSSKRKRMSVIYRDQEGHLLLLSKGADSVMYQRLARGQSEELLAATQDHLEEFANVGLRTLVLARKDISEDEYVAWAEKHHEAKTSIRDRKAKLEAVYDEIERGLILLGATAIEDKLQEKVPETIENLAKSGISLWVLTGDKLETAINIAYACNLLNDEMNIFKVEGVAEGVPTSSAKTTNNMTGSVSNGGAFDEHDPVTIVSAQLGRLKSELEADTDSATEYALVIDGNALTTALNDDCKELFAEASLGCKAVVCCRVSPLQKAEVTTLVKEAGFNTLAIGDGANDVGMIQRAGIGVGISGFEGRQAVLAADFAIAQFRFLERLLLVHGRLSYKRQAQMINYFFYKSSIVGYILFIGNGLTFWSGQPIVNDFALSLYSPVFTALTPFLLGLLEVDVGVDAGIKYPRLYQIGQTNALFDSRQQIRWGLNALYNGVMISLIVYGSILHFTDGPADSGRPIGLEETGVILFTCLLLTVDLQLVFLISNYTWLHWLFLGLSLLSWFLFLVIFEFIPLSWFSTNGLFGLYSGIMASSPTYILVSTLVPVACVLPWATFDAAQLISAPKDETIIREAERYKKVPPGDGPVQKFSVVTTKLDNVSFAPTSDKGGFDLEAKGTGGLHEENGVHYSVSDLTLGEDEEDLYEDTPTYREQEGRRTSEQVSADSKGYPEADALDSDPYADVELVVTDV
eukprot:scaffold568_cov376-Prasinococcus_capsulatus_cf.AAC.17